MNYISIDPGAAGAISVFRDKDLLFVFDIPFLTIEKQKVMDFKSARSIIDSEIDTVDAVFIEAVSSRTGQGVKSMFSFGERFGEAKSFGLTLTSNLIFLSPQKWKAACGLTGFDKIESAKRAAKLYPKQANLFVEKNNRCKDGVKYFDGRADSVFIGLIGYKLNGE